MKIKVDTLSSVLLQGSAFHKWLGKLVKILLLHILCSLLLRKKNSDVDILQTFVKCSNTNSDVST